MTSSSIPTTSASTLGAPPEPDVLARRIRHAIDDSLDSWDAHPERRTADDAAAVAELAKAHQALAA